jgi:genome maintenance exonuclease 1
VTPVDLQRVEVDGKRYYALPSGMRFKSVTTVLGEKLDKSWLVSWRERVGNEQADLIMKRAAARGTIVHSLAEKFMSNKDIGSANPVHLYAFEGAARHLRERVSSVLGIELPLYSKFLRCAGTADLVCYYDGEPTVVDFKTSLRLKDEERIESYFLQSACYSMMFSHLYQIPVRQFVVLICADHEPVQVFKKDVSSFVERVVSVFRE